MNVASRMESNSFPSCMHVSNSVVQQSQNQANMFVSLGERAIKGKGNMHTHLYKVAAFSNTCKQPAVVPLLPLLLLWADGYIGVGGWIHVRAWDAAGLPKASCETRQTA